MAGDGARSGTTDGRGQDEPVAVLRRWEQRGAGWQVVGRGSEGLAVALLTCDGGEEVDRLVSADPALADYLAGRESSEPAAGR